MAAEPGASAAAQTQARGRLPLVILAKLPRTIVVAGVKILLTSSSNDALGAGYDGQHHRWTRAFQMKQPMQRFDIHTNNPIIRLGG